MKPNASLLTFLTIPDKSHEKIIFLYLKELDEIAPTEIFWYGKRGKFGEAHYLWTQHKLRQWLAVGNDDEIKLLWDKFKDNKGLDIHKIFVKPGILEEKVIDEEDIHKIPGIKPCKRSFRKQYFTIQNWEKEIGHLIEFLFEETTLNYLEGFMKEADDIIRPVDPPGLFEKGFLYNMLAKNIIAVVEKRGIFWTLKGITENRQRKKDPKTFVGFVQDKSQNRVDYKVRLCDADNIFRGEVDIEPQTGFWRMVLDSPLGKGNFYLFNKKNDSIICGEKFYLVKDLIINGHIITATFKDLYNRKFTYSSGNLKTYKDMKKPSGFTWYKKNYPNERIAEIDLSNKLSEIIAFLGPKILIVDPYLLGDIKEKNGIPILITAGQTVFINALLLALSKSKIEEILFLGHSVKVKRMYGTPQEEITKSHTAIFKQFDRFSLKKVSIKFSKEPFHDRYWIGLRESDEAYFVTNSISGLVESYELSLASVEGIEKTKIVSRILKRWQEGGEEHIIYDRSA